MENMNLPKYLQFNNNISKLLPNKSLPSSFNLHLNYTTSSCKKAHLDISENLQKVL